MVTRNEILGAIAEVEAQVAAWEGSRDESLLQAFNGRTVKALNAAVEAAAVSLFELADNASIDEEAYDLLEAIDKFDDAFQEFVRLSHDPGNRTNPGGTREFWGAYAAVLRSRQPRHWARPDPIRQLLNQKVSIENIAKQYCWIQEYGLERAREMVQEESDNPGTHYNRDTWIHPAHAAYRERLQMYALERSEQIRRAQQEAAKRAAAGPKAPKQPAHETLDQLIVSGTHLKQILKMKPGLTAEHVTARADELGYPLENADSPQYVSYREAMQAREAETARSRQAQIEADHRELLAKTKPAEINTYPEFGEDLRARALRMSEDGLRPGKIAEALQSHPGAPTAALVGRWVREASEPAAAEQ